MSKSIEDYRNIVKILKLQLLKIREENATLSHDLGIASESETSSFTSKINHYKASKEPFAKIILAHLLFAHRCEIIGITPQMVFRIADKKRDKSVDTDSFSQILRRLKLRMSPIQIQQLVNLIKKKDNSNEIIYEQYLQALSAFQVNSEKYPLKSSRTYVQLCLLKFGEQAKIYKEADNLFKEMSRRGKSNFLSFEDYASFVRNEMRNMTQYETIAVFVGLDMRSECLIDRQIFIRQVGKVYSLQQKGVKVEDELSLLKIDSVLTSKLKQTEKQSRSRAAQNKRTRQRPQRLQSQEKIVPQKEDDKDFQQVSETADQAKRKVVKKQPKKQIKEITSDKEIKLSPRNSKNIINKIKQKGILIGDFLENLLKRQKKTEKLVRSLTINDFFQALQTEKYKFTKKETMALFKDLDSCGQGKGNGNGTIDTSELLKLWIRANPKAEKDTIIYSLLNRHLRQIQFPDPEKRFEVLGIPTDKKLTEQDFQQVFINLELSDREIKKIMAQYIGSMPIDKFCSQVKRQGKFGYTRPFTKMSSEVKSQFDKILNQIKIKGNCRWRKRLRLETGQKSTAEEYWEYIFTDQWACWKYCLETAVKLDTFWRDPEFGPTSADPSGIRSIVGNESDPPPGLPQQSQIKWISFEEYKSLHGKSDQQDKKKKKKEQEANFREGDINPNHVVQGELGDCWFVSSLSIIANKKEYVKGYQIKQCSKIPELATYGVNPYLFKFFSQFGMYVFKFFKNFQPVYVVIDDLFPARASSNQLMFAKSPDASASWPSFLEKAYAKLHHTYSSMISGDISQGLNDLTNSLPIKEKLSEEKLVENQQKIKKLNQARQLMGCSIAPPKTSGPQGGPVEQPVTLDDQQCGLFYSHAYSILDFLDLKISKKDKSQIIENFDLIRVRNPHGQGEWLLDWSDHPQVQQYNKLPKYQQNIKTFYQQKRNSNGFPKTYEINEDGQFLMTFSDFNKIYTNLFTGLTLENFNSNYEGQKISLKWDKNVPSGICKLKDPSEEELINFIKNNHQFILEVKQETDILMYIVQEDGRLYRGEKYPYNQLCSSVNIFIFTLDDNKPLDKFDKKKFDKNKLNSFDFQKRREVNKWKKFPKGSYAIVPVKIKGKIEVIEETDFEFRIYNQKDKSIKIKPANGTSTFKKIQQSEKSKLDNKLYTQFLNVLDKNLKKK